MAYTKEQREAKKKPSLETENSVQKTVKEDKKKATSLSIKNLTPSTTSVWVKNNTYGELNYISKKTGFQTSWEGHGAIQPLTLEELIVMRNSQMMFFEQNWIMIEGFVDSEYEEMFSAEEIIEFLQVKQYYKGFLCLDNIDSIFTMNPDEIEDKISKMSAGFKNSIIVRANDLINSGEIDSRKVISTLEKALKTKFSLDEE